MSLRTVHTKFNIYTANNWRKNDLWSVWGFWTNLMSTSLKVVNMAHVLCASLSLWAILSLIRFIFTWKSTQSDVSTAQLNGNKLISIKKMVWYPVLWAGAFCSSLYSSCRRSRCGFDGWNYNTVKREESVLIILKTSSSQHSQNEKPWVGLCWTVDLTVTDLVWIGWVDRAEGVQGAWWWGWLPQEQQQEERRLPEAPLQEEEERLLS